MQKKDLTPRQYRVLAIIWTLAAAAIAVAFVRRLAEFNLLLLLLLALSTLTAANFWKAYGKTQNAGTVERNPFAEPPVFSDNPELFDDPPPPVGSQLSADGKPACTPNQDSEENDK